MVFMSRNSTDADVDCHNCLDNCEIVQKLNRENERVLGLFKKFNGSIKNMDDAAKHMERLQKCSWCKRDFYDKLCPDCVTDEVNERVKKAFDCFLAKYSSQWIQGNPLSPREVEEILEWLWKNTN